MKRKSILYKDLEVSRAKEIYDESCKNILANKIILAWIMKSCMKEYKDCSIRDVADHYIEGIPEISQRVERGTSTDDEEETNHDTTGCDRNNQPYL